MRIGQNRLLRSRRSSSVAVCTFAADRPERLVATLRLLRTSADEIAVAVAAGSAAAETPELEGVADRCYRVQEMLPPDRYVPWLHSLCSTDWILWLAPGEVPGAGFLAALPELIRRRDVHQYRQPVHRVADDGGGWTAGEHEAIRLVRNDPATLRFAGASAAPVLPARRLAEAIYRLNDSPAESTEIHPTPAEDLRLLERVLAEPAARGRREISAVDVSLGEIDRFWPQRDFDERGYEIELSCLDDELALTVGRERTVDVAVRNLGPETFPWGGGPPDIRAAYHWLDANGETVVFDGQRTALPANVGPGEEAVVPVRVVPPLRPGRYVLELDLVHEGVRWFERTTRVAAEVVAPARAVRTPAAALETENRVICVTGMHRSGTSLVTRILNLLGVYLGEPDELLPAAEDNKAGFWERQDIVALNDELLALAGGAAIAPPALAPGWAEAPTFDPLRRRAAELSSAWMDGRPVVGWKDPRNSLTLPFWRTVVPVDATVLAIRHPLEVARSLERRNGLAEREAARLYVAYVVSALRNDPDCVVVRYADLLDATGPTVERLCGELGLELPGDAGPVHAVVEGALRSERLEDLPGDGPSAVAVRVYQRLVGDDRDGVLRVADELLEWSLGLNASA